MVTKKKKSITSTRLKDGKSSLGHGNFATAPVNVSLSKIEKSPLFCIGSFSVLLRIVLSESEGELPDFWNWDDILFSEDKFCLRKEVKNSPLFMHHFAQAELFKDSNDKKAAAESVKETISNFKNDACSL